MAERISELVSAKEIAEHTVRTLSVSYTHLDVYKRQVLWTVITRTSGHYTVERSFNMIYSHEVEAVSYTHLDVYKRQVLVEGI